MVRCQVSCELISRDSTVRLTLKDNRQWEYRTIGGNCHGHGRTLRLIRRRTNVDGFYTDHLKRLLPRHAEEDWHLIYVEDEMPVAMWALEEWTHEICVVRCLCRDVVGLALRFMRAHAIDKRIGTQESLHSAAPSNEMLRVELGGERRCLYHEIERVHGDALLALLKGVPEQDILEQLQLPEQSRVIRLPPAL